MRYRLEGQTASHVVAVGDHFHLIQRQFAGGNIRVVNVFQLCQMPGRCGAGFTLRTYTHTTSRQQAEAADRMGSLVAQDL